MRSLSVFSNASVYDIKPMTIFYVLSAVTLEGKRTDANQSSSSQGLEHPDDSHFKKWLRVMTITFSKVSLLRMYIRLLENMIPK